MDRSKFNHHFNAGTDPQGVSGYDDVLDRARLVGQIERVYNAVAGGKWWTLGEIESRTGDPQASISAQLRHLRKERFGSHRILKRRRGEETSGLWEYRFIKGPFCPVHRKSRIRPDHPIHRKGTDETTDL